MKSSVAKAFTMVLQIGLTMAVPIALCVLLGMWLNEKFETDWIMIPLLIAGIGAGGRNIWIMLKSFTKSGNSREAKANDAIRHMLAEGKEKNRNKKE